MVDEINLDKELVELMTNLVTACVSNNLVSESDFSTRSGRVPYRTIRPLQSVPWIG